MIHPVSCAWLILTVIVISTYRGRSQIEESYDLETSRIMNSLPEHVNAFNTHSTNVDLLVAKIAITQEKLAETIKEELNVRKGIPLIESEVENLEATVKRTVARRQDEDSMRSLLLNQRSSLKVKLNKLEWVFPLSMDTESPPSSDDVINQRRKKLGRCPREEEDASIPIGDIQKGKTKCTNPNKKTPTLSEFAIDSAVKELDLVGNKMKVLHVDTECGVTTLLMQQRLGEGTIMMGAEPDSDIVAYNMNSTTITTSSNVLFCASPYLHWLPRKTYDFAFTLSLLDCDKLHLILASVKLGGVVWFTRQSQVSVKALETCQNDIDVWARLEGATIRVDVKEDRIVLGPGENRDGMFSIILRKYAWAPSVK
eukprot:PhF_6_TR2556/c0_g1_i1/m.4334